MKPVKPVSPLVRCICTSEFQDKLYGQGMRVTTEGGGKGNVILRCTVCGKEHRKS